MGYDSFCPHTQDSWTDTYSGKTYTWEVSSCRPHSEREFFIDNLLVRIHLIIEMILVDRPCAVGAVAAPIQTPMALQLVDELEKGIQTPMARGRSTKTISVMRWIRTSWSSIKNSLSLPPPTGLCGTCSMDTSTKVSLDSHDLCRGLKA